MTAQENGVAGRGIGRRGTGPGRRRVRFGRRRGPGLLHVRGAAARRGQADRHGVRGDALLDQRGDGRAGGRGPLDGDGRAAAGSGAGEDKRFADPTWTDNPAFYALRQAHLATSRLVSELLEAGSGNAVDDAKAALATGFLLDALAPTNFLLTNPAALKRMFETGGASLVAGTSHFVDDVLNNKGRPRQVDTRPFRVGENLAATPGKVVFKNELMELIQYAPQTPKVHAIPVLASPPWINKYYVMDLAPGRSFLEWAVQHERTVFAISYRNPDRLHGRHDPG